VDRKEILYNFLYSRNVSSSIKTSFMYNYDGFQGEPMQVVLEQYKIWRDTFIESKHGTYYDILLLVRLPCYGFILTTGLI
jgi:hypothetical protein